VKEPLVRRPIVIVPLAVGGAVALVIALLWDDQWRWAAPLAVACGLVLLFSDTGIRLDAAIGCTALFATAVYWDNTRWRIPILVAGVLSIWAVRRIGAMVWPDVAIFFLIALTAVAVGDAWEEKLKPEQRPAPVAVFDLPQSRIQPPTSDLPAPSKVEIFAFTRAAGGAIAGDGMRLGALLLTPIKRSGAPQPVRVVIERGKDSSAAMALARATLEPTEFVLLPAGECFVAPRRIGLTPERAMTLLDGHGFSAATARDYVESFEGLVDYVAARPGVQFRRYFSGRRTVGRFLTDAEFATSAEARDGLELPKDNRATFRQTVRAIAPAMTLRGRIKSGLDSALQFLVLRPGCFQYGRGERVG
jgi:hypothetical protein